MRDFATATAPQIEKLMGDLGFADEVHVVVTVRDLGRQLPSVWQGKIAFFGSAALCSEAGASELQGFFANRVKDLEGGPRALAQGVEGVKLCTARVAKHQQH